MTLNSQLPAWWIYTGQNEPPGRIGDLPEAPPWRSFTGQPTAAEDHDFDIDPQQATVEAESSRRLGRYRQAVAYQADDEEKDLVNLALHLRRPLLVTGQPGVGKSTLAYSVAHELGLGPVLRWPITSRSTLHDGLYNYDAIGRLQEVSLRRETMLMRPLDKDGFASATDDQAPGEADGAMSAPDIGRYLRLGPVGTALLPRSRPRALLIDEIDKSDIDLPGDLLNIFEEGEFIIPELARLKQPDVRVMTADEGNSATLHHGLVRCREFPFVVLTSNSERSFPKAFLRRCIRLEIGMPRIDKLARMVNAHLGEATPEVAKVRRDLIAQFLAKQDEQGAILANDQLLNALLMASAGLGDDGGRAIITKHLLRPLDED